MAKRKSMWEKKAPESQEKVADLLDQVEPDSAPLELENEPEQRESVPMSQRLKADERSADEIAKEKSAQQAVAKEQAAADHVDHPKFSKFKKGTK